MNAPLRGVRIVEVSALGPAAITTSLADMGAEVIKIEPPGGDYIREVTWPIVEGTSLMHLHINRAKKSLVLDLTSNAGMDVLRDLVRTADVVVEAMRPGALERRGLGFDELVGLNPSIVFCSISGYGATGPYRDLPSHGIAYDTWAGIVNVATDEDGFDYLVEHASVGIHAGPLYGALGILAAIISARSTGVGSHVEIAQSDAAAAMDWYRSESWKAYERPQSEVTGNKADSYERRPPGTAGMKDGVRYQVYAARDGRHVLLMASEKKFWNGFCEAVGRTDLFEKWPGADVADHARGNRELQRELREIFKTRSSDEWLALAVDSNLPIAPVNTPKTLLDDPQFKARFELLPADVLGCHQLQLPLKFDGVPPGEPHKAPTVNEHADFVLHDLLGLDDDRIDELERLGAFGP